MNTFLPYAESAACLDRQRLGKQRVEVLQLLRALLVPGAGWANHPAARMWRGCEGQLALYGHVVCEEWVRRGYRDTCAEKIRSLALPVAPRPTWFGDEAFHASHRSNLLRKDFAHYSRFGWSEPNDLPYIWPESCYERGAEDRSAGAVGNVQAARGRARLRQDARP